MNFEKKSCKCCNFPLENDFIIKNKIYFFCKNCNSIFLCDDFFLSPENQVNRYLLHNNTLEDINYKNYLEKFINRVLEFINLEKIDFLDYGSGPNPCLVELIKEKFFNFNKIDGWDLFFTRDFFPKENSYSLITCLEVAEHFENPQESFRHISSLLKKDGFLAIQTQFFECEEDITNTEKKFATWWYKEDTTHVTFYSKEGLISCCKSFGLKFLTQLDKNLVIFTKID